MCAFSDAGAAQMHPANGRRQGDMRLLCDGERVIEWAATRKMLERVAIVVYSDAESSVLRMYRIDVWEGCGDDNRAAKFMTFGEVIVYSLVAPRDAEAESDAHVSPAHVAPSSPLLRKRC